MGDEKTKDKPLLSFPVLKSAGSCIADHTSDNGSENQWEDDFIQHQAEWDEEEGEKGNPSFP